MLLDSSRQLGQSVGAKLRAARQARKLTQGQLAQPDFSVSYISAIERGQIQPSLRALEILARRLEISTADLLPHRGQAVDENSVSLEGVSLQEEEHKLLFLEARIALYQGNSEQAIELLKPCVSQAQKGGQKQDLRLAILLGEAYLEGGHLQESEQILFGVARAAKEYGDLLYPHILSLQSAIYGATHNSAAAIRLLQESLAQLDQKLPGNGFLMARIYNSLGQHYSSLEEFALAQTMFEKALLAVQAYSSYEQLLSVYWDLFLYYKERDESEQIFIAAYKWSQTTWQIRAATLRSEIRHVLGRAWLKSRPEKAYAYLLTEYQQTADRQDALSHASACTHLASWLIARERFCEAESYAREARDQAFPFGETVIAAEALLLLGEIMYRQQIYQDGDQYFEAGLHMLERLGEEEDLVEYLTCYAHLLEMRGLIPRAITFWKRAYAYQQKKRDDSFL